MTESFEEFDDLKIIFDKNIATGTNAIGLGDTTDAQKTVGVAETEKEQKIVVKSYLFMTNKTMNLNHRFFLQPSK